jgi:hypothetical protein
MIEFSLLLSLYKFNYRNYENNDNIYEYNDLSVRLKFEFIKYEKFIRIKYGTENKSIIIRIENLKKNKLLFQYYIASLLCCVNKDKNNYNLFSAISSINFSVIHHINLNIRKKNLIKFYILRNQKEKHQLKNRRNF